MIVQSPPNGLTGPSNTARIGQGAENPRPRRDHRDEVHIEATRAMKADPGSEAASPGIDDVVSVAIS